MTKKLFKFLIVCGLAAVAGLVLYTQTNIGKTLMDDAVKDSDIDVSSVTGDTMSGNDTDELLNQEVEEFFDDVGTGDSGQDTGLVLFASGTLDASLLQKRLEYYKSHKKELGM